MRIYHLAILLFFVNYSLFASHIRPLNFDQTLPINCIANLLQPATQLFYVIEYSTIQDLEDHQILTKIINRLLDLIGAIYLFNYQTNQQSKICYIKPADLLYLANLIHDINFAFNKLVFDLNSDQIKFISNLFLQIELLVGNLTKPSLHQLCH